MGNFLVKKFFKTNQEKLETSDLNEFHKMQAVDIQGKEIRFETFKKNKLLLIVNVASK